MEEGSGTSFDDFSIEMADFEVRKVRKYDRLFNIGEGGSIDTRPLIIHGKIYFGSHNKNVYCLDAAAGRLLWKFRAADSCGISSAAYSDGKVFIGSYDHNLYALDAETGRLVWKFSTRREIIESPTVRDGVIFIGSVDQNFYAIDAKTGKLKWKFWTNGEIISDATFYEDLVVFGSYDKNLYCLTAEGGRLMWKLATSQEIINGGDFAIKDGFVYFASFDNLLRKIEVRTGREMWKKKICQYGITCGTVIHNGVLYVPTEDGILFAFDLDGNIIWKFTTKKPIGMPTVEGGRIYLTAEDNNLYCISLEGKLVWKFRTFEANWWKPAVEGGVVYFGSYDCNFYALDAEDGKLLWKFRADGSPSRIPPPYREFELSIKIPEKEVEEEERGRYDISEKGPEEHVGAYKSRITYQVSTQYREKGKYQTDDDL
jgi:outer membrane protein assembly factor BamB